MHAECRVWGNATCVTAQETQAKITFSPMTIDVQKDWWHLPFICFSFRHCSVRASHGFPEQTHLTVLGDFRRRMAPRNVQTIRVLIGDLRMTIHFLYIEFPSSIELTPQTDKFSLVELVAIFSDRTAKLKGFWFGRPSNVWSMPTLESRSYWDKPQLSFNKDESCAQLSSAKNAGLDQPIMER